LHTHLDENDYIQSVLCVGLVHAKVAIWSILLSDGVLAGTLKPA